MDAASDACVADGARVAADAAAGHEGNGQVANGSEQPPAEKPVGAAILELLARSTGGTDQGQDAISNLQHQRKELLEERKRLTRALKNETRKRKRVLNRSARLTNADLVEVLQIRQTRAIAKAKAAAA